MDTSKLRADTRAVWETLDGHPSLHGFVLIGGTALTLRIGHRVSEDLDFAYADRHLPRRRLEVLQRVLPKSGVNLVSNQSPVDEEEFLEAGLDLADYQQNFIANGTVKVSFVALDTPSDRILAGDADSHVRIATLDEIFALKCLVCAERSKSRDWFDLYILMTRHGFAIQDFYDVFARLNVMSKFESASMRLRACRTDSGDEGYEQLLEDAPSLDDMHAFFELQLNALEVRLAKEAFSTPSLDE